MKVNRKTSITVRKTHRYLGLFIGLQFLMWTISGLYFSWTNIDDIHGDQFKNLDYKPPVLIDTLINPSNLNVSGRIRTLELRRIAGQSYYWINDQELFNATNGQKKNGITEQEAILVAKNHLKENIEVEKVELITETDKHHEYRRRLLPAYVVSIKHDENIKAYVSQIDGKFQTVRHRSWRWFDFLWMTHTMDYEGRDDFNTTVLRAFSLLGLLTVLSGFLLWFITSPRVRKLMKIKSRK